MRKVVVYFMTIYFFAIWKDLKNIFVRSRKKRSV
jgi:hypothetical protein